MTIPVAKCSSCGACANVCARGAITMQLDKEGFYRPIIDESICSKCGACERACPWLKNVSNPNENTESPKTIAAYAKDEPVRLESSSGGIFSVLAEHVLDDGGVVAGVAQVAPTRFEHIFIENKADLSKLRGSKYVQANPGMIYKQVRALLIGGRKVLFSGTPLVRKNLIIFGLLILFAMERRVYLFLKSIFVNRKESLLHLFFCLIFEINARGGALFL